MKYQEKEIEILSRKTVSGKQIAEVVILYTVEVKTVPFSELSDEKKVPTNGEIAWAARHALTIHFSLPRAELVRETARLFGYARIGNNVEETCSRGVDQAITQNLIEVQNGKMIVAEVSSSA